MINKNSKKKTSISRDMYFKFYKIQFSELLKYTTINFNLNSNFNRPKKFKPSLPCLGNLKIK